MKRPAWKLTRVEQEVIAEVRALRAAGRNDRTSDLLRNPARLVRHLLLSHHGNVQLRFGAVAREIGTEMRTLERLFALEYKCTMTDFQQACRLRYACALLKESPPIKISAVALYLGYEHSQDFNRFFKREMFESPSVWGFKKREEARKTARVGKKRDEER